MEGARVRTSETGGRIRVLVAFLLVALLCATVVLVGASPAVAGRVYYVSTTGSDSNAGTFDSPWRTIRKGLTSLDAGDTMYVRGGTYIERLTGLRLAVGTATGRITVKAYQGERAVLKGLLWLSRPNYWTFDGLSVTWDAATGHPSEHMVKFVDGNNWVFRNADVWGARSYAAILVAGDSAGWRLSRLYVHDTYATHGDNQDDLLAVVGTSHGGVIENSVLANSPNGRAIRVGPAWSTDPVAHDITIRYNTMYNNLGPTSVQIMYGAHDTSIYRNIMVKTDDRPNVGKWQLSGARNVSNNNIGWLSKSVVGKPPLVNGGGNSMLDPQLADPARGDFRATNPAAVGYGAPFPSSAPDATSSPTSSSSPTNSSGPYRAFPSISYWNTPLPADAPVDPNSAEMIDWIKADSTTNYIFLSGLADTKGSWGMPIYWAKDGDPTYAVKNNCSWNQPPEFSSVRIPRGANPDQTSDSAMTVYDVEKGIVYGFWLAKYDSASDSWSSCSGTVYYLNSNGLDGRLAQSDQVKNRGHRGVPPSTFAVRYDEVVAGRIEHMLKIALNTTKCSHVFPMTGDECGTTARFAPPEGAVIRIKPSIDLSKKNLSPAALVIATALQRYGAIIGDQTGGPAELKTENVVQEGRGALWSGLLTRTSLASIPLTDFEVIQLGYRA